MVFADFKKTIEERTNERIKEDENYQRRLEEAKAKVLEEAKKKAEFMENNRTSEHISDGISVNEVLYGKPLFRLHGCRGRHMFIYEDFVIIKVKPNVGSVITANATDGEKIIFLCDCIGLQVKEAGATIGYIQIETASSQMNNIKSGWYNENTFTFDIYDRPIREAYEYLFNRIKEIKTND